jgi:hypothetical protein
MHRDRGLTTDSCPGSREMHTFKKLPNSSPTPNPTNSNQITPEVYGCPMFDAVDHGDTHCPPHQFRTAFSTAKLDTPNTIKEWGSSLCVVSVTVGPDQKPVHLGH